MAAGALIDAATVHQLVTAQAETIAGIAVAHSRDAEPDNAAECWLRVEPPRLEWLPRQRVPDEPDSAEFEVDIFVFVGAAKTKAGALATAAQHVVAAFDGVTLRDAAQNTVVDCRRCVMHGVVDVDELDRLETGMVTIRGTVKRTAGRTVQDFLT